MEQQIDDHQHESRNAQQPRKYIFAHDRSPVELSNVEPALSLMRRTAHEDNAALVATAL
jgi:hypothetical protein